MIFGIYICSSFVVMSIVKNQNQIYCSDTFVNSYNRTNNQTNSSIGDSGSGGGLNPAKGPSFYVVLIILILFCGAFVVGSVYTYFYSKKTSYDSIDPELKKPTKLTKSAIEDLPSSDVQTIVLPTKQLKPVDNSALVWKQNTNDKKVEDNYQNKANDRENRETKVKAKKKSKQSRVG